MELWWDSSIEDQVEEFRDWLDAWEVGGIGDGGLEEGKGFKGFRKVKARAMMCCTGAQCTAMEWR